VGLSPTPSHLVEQKIHSTLLNKTGFEILSMEFEPLRFNYVKGFILGYLRNIFFKKEIIQKRTRRKQKNYFTFEQKENKSIFYALS